MFSRVVLVACVLVCVFGSFVDVTKDFVRSDISEGDLRERNWTERRVSDFEVGYEDGFERGRGDSKDLLMPVVIGVLVKIFTVLPVFLTTLALMAGFSFAFSKVALIISGGLTLFYYLKENSLLVPLASSFEGYPKTVPKVIPFIPPSFFEHPLLEENPRDRRLFVQRRGSAT